MNTEKVQVYRTTPTPGKGYYHVEYDSRTGHYPNELYFCDRQKLRYVGKYVKETREGYGDSVLCYAHFDLDGQEVIVQYSYEGKTCFVEA
jgi:hypothetical protein